MARTLCRASSATARLVLDFVRVCITKPAPAQLPGSLRLTHALLPYAAKLTPFLPFLPALPVPFTYCYETRTQARGNAFYFFECADRGNAAYARRERAAAVEASTDSEAADILEHVLTMGHGERDMLRPKKLRAEDSEDDEDDTEEDSEDDEDEDSEDAQW
ncbi:hypothetical protein FA95DRAFT_1606516 [Auriscalpium vulgare]|uniref:Uncharacterized protein n=1 Tax=Auriscalpium vulgare TaxID=40419 RepID=A0ACB8RTL8_9AGAM|nr:hypothetical protein FA95DRAFT_1606516 [Auriscalpium vulgare]